MSQTGTCWSLPLFRLKSDPALRIASVSQGSRIACLPLSPLILVMRESHSREAANTEIKWEPEQESHQASSQNQLKSEYSLSRRTPWALFPGRLFKRRTEGEEENEKTPSPQLSPFYLCNCVNEAHLRKEHGIGKREMHGVAFPWERAALIFHLTRVLGGGGEAPKREAHWVPSPAKCLCPWIWPPW